jgi:hypothetical protein
MYKGGVVYQGEVHTTPDHDHGPVSDYTNEQLLYLCSDFQLHHKVDEALERIGNKLLIAEVARFCRMMDGIQWTQKEIHNKEDELYCHTHSNCKLIA